jgi:hypothetical protein
MLRVGRAVLLRADLLPVVAVPSNNLTTRVNLAICSLTSRMMFSIGLKLSSPVHNKRRQRISRCARKSAYSKDHATCELAELPEPSNSVRLPWQSQGLTLAQELADIRLVAHLDGIWRSVITV